MRKLAILLSLSFLFIGCTDRSNQLGLDKLAMEGDHSMYEMEIQPTTEQSNFDEDYIPSPTTFVRKIIKEGYVEIKSLDIQRSRFILDSLVIKYDCYLSSDFFEDGSTYWEENLNIRIPSDYFDQFIRSLDLGPDKIQKKMIRSSDVTEQFYDLKTRIDNNKIIEKRYLELLTKATIIKDVLEIEKALGVTRGEIESQQGRLNRLNNEIAFSTLEVLIKQAKPNNQVVSDRDPFSKKLYKSLKSGWFGFVDFVVILFNIWPLWIGGLITWYIIGIIRKRRKV